MKNFLILFLLLVITTLQSVTSSLYAEVKQDDLRIGTVLYLSGDLAMQANAFKEGIELAAKLINEKGGVRGKRVKLIFEDSNGPKSTHTAAKKLLKQDRIFASLLQAQADVMAAGPLFEAAKVPTICLWDSNPAIDAAGDYIFAIGPWTPSAGEVSADFATNKLKAKSAVIVHQTESWSEDVAKYFKATFTKNGGKILRTFNLDPALSDFRSVVTAIKGLKPDVIYSPLVFNLVPFYRTLSLQKVNAKVMSSDIISEQHIERAPEAFEGIYQSALQDPDSTEYQKLATLYKKHFKKEIKLPWFTATGFDGLNLIIEATKRARFNSEEVAKALYQTKNYRGASRVLSINKHGSAPQMERMYQVRDTKIRLVP